MVVGCRVSGVSSIERRDRVGNENAIEIEDQEPDDADIFGVSLTEGI